MVSNAQRIEWDGKTIWLNLFGMAKEFAISSTANEAKVGMMI
jgi:hypothetical protein